MMPVLTTCPKCGDPLINEFSHLNKIRKTCRKRVDHQFQIIISSSDELVEAISVTLSMSPLTRVGWDFINNTCVVAVGTLEEILKRKDDGYKLPFWDPDFSNWDELIKKVRTYLIFS